MDSSTLSAQLEEIRALHPSAAKSALEAPSDAALRVPCYCEENVWRLAFRKLWNGMKSGNTSSRFHVLFVSNPDGCVPMFQQLASSQRDKPIFWDYHVILLEQRNSSGTRIWDIDCHLECPCDFERYMEHVFFRHEQWPEHYQPYFRVVEALTFLQYFSSDRSHMIDEDGNWSAPPPEYECIVKKGKEGTAPHTLHGYMTISEEEAEESDNLDWGETGNGDGANAAVDDKTKRPMGVVCTLPQLQERFGG